MTGHSEQLSELASALVKAQSAMRVIEAGSVACIEGDVGPRSYRYADLASVWAAVRKPLTRHGLSIVQTCEPSSRGELRLTTTLLHESGQWVSGTETVPVLAPTPQAYGSALTYARRYGLAAILGVCVDDDDDGAAASKPMVRRQGQSNGAQAEGVAAHREQLAAEANRAPRATPAVEPGWKETPYNRASERDLKAFAKAYAEAKGLESVSSEDLRRDFGVDGKLIDHFGATTLGQIVEGATSAGAQLEAETRREPFQEAVVTADSSDAVGAI